MTRDRTVTILSLILPVCLSSSPHFRSKFFRVESNKLVHAEEASHERLPGPSRSQEHGQFGKKGVRVGSQREENLLSECRKEARATYVCPLSLS